MPDRDNQIVAGEPSCGTPHLTGRATPGAWDLSGRTEATGAPYTWDLAALGLPVGTKEVLITLQVYFSTAGQTADMYATAWDYDFGTYDAYEVLARGLRAVCSGLPAVAGGIYRVAEIKGYVKIGASRKLKMAVSGTAGCAFAAMYCGYNC